MKIALSSFILFFMFAGLIQAANIVSGATYKITTYSTGNKTLSINNSSFDSSAGLVAWTETGTNSQRWRVTKGEADDYFRLTNAYTNKSLRITGSINPGMKVTQNDLTSSSFFRWEFSPVEEDGYDDCYYISLVSTTTSGEKVYMEVADNSEGAGITLQLKKEGSGASRQIWKIELAEEISNTLTNEVREEMMQGWKNRYYNVLKTSTGFWGEAEMLETILDAYETTGNPEYREMFEEVYEHFVSSPAGWGRPGNGQDWRWNEYNDDIAWAVLASVRAYLMFGEHPSSRINYLTIAKNNFGWMYERAKLPSGMLRWKERDSNTANGTNSCINGPAEVAACYLAIATGDDSYYTIAKDLYALQRQYLYEPSTGKVFDSGSWNGNVFTVGNHWVSTYNQGTFLGAALMLYNHYRTAQYLNDARKIMEWTRKDLCNANGIIHVCQIENDDLSGFKGILMRYVRRFIVDTGETNYEEWMQKNALHAYNNRNSAGVTSSAWLTKTPENFILGDRNFRNSPFGPSTAISAAFNAPLDKVTIIKNAFSKIEAENFNYLKGVYTESNSDSEDGTFHLSNLNEGFWTAYNYVDFGNNTAKNIKFRIANAANAGTIEIRLGGISGTLIGTADIPTTNGWSDWTTINCEIEPTSGVQNIYLVFKGSGDLFKLNYFTFGEEEEEEEINVVVEEPTPTGNDGKGSIGFSLEIPGNVGITGSFNIELPQGYTLDETTTILSEILAGFYELVITPAGNNTWRIEVVSNGLRATHNLTEYTQIMSIGYIVDESVENGIYQIELKDIEMQLENGTPITQESIMVTAKVDRDITALFPTKVNNIHVYSAQGNIVIENAPADETIHIYNVSGILVASKQTQNITSLQTTITLPQGIYIVKIGGANFKIKN